MVNCCDSLSTHQTTKRQAISPLKIISTEQIAKNSTGKVNPPIPLGLDANMIASIDPVTVASNTGMNIRQAIVVLTNFREGAMALIASKLREERNNSFR